MNYYVRFYYLLCSLLNTFAISDKVPIECNFNMNLCNIKFIIMTKKRLFCSIMSMLLFCMLCAQSAFGQKLAVTGNVTDNNGYPVIGASVLVEGTTNGTITDMDGNFKLSDVPAKGNLQVSFIGYKPQTIKVNGQTKFDIKLLEDTQTLDEVVVVGYGVMRKSDLTGSVASVKASDAIKSTPVANVSDALQGRLAGVSIAGGGDPSKSAAIRIRGVNSVTADVEPLLVVDGFIGGSLKNINPNDIQSIEVLKDASATAVYGSRAANGVILVTTKNAKEDKVVINFNAFANLKTVLDKPDVLSAGEFAELANDYAKEFFANKPRAPYYTEEQIADFKQGKGGYNYVDHIFNEPAVAQNYDLSIAGKSGKTSYLASFRYENTDGVIKESNYQQYNWRLKLDTELKKWLSVGLNLWGDYSENKGPRMTQYNGLLMTAMNFAPTVQPKNEKGVYNNRFAIDGGPAYNPMGHIWELDEKVKRLDNYLQGYADFKIMDGLTFRSQLGITFTNNLSNAAHNERSYEYFANSQTSAIANSAWTFKFLNTNTLNYTKEFNKNHRINATAVFEQAHSNRYQHKGAGRNLTFPDLLTYNALDASEIGDVSSDLVKHSLISYLARVNYVLMNRYMLTASVRADGSAALADKWDYFPSVALAWDIKQEKFMEKYDWMDQFKLRVGYGSVGNQAVEMYRIFSKMVASKNSDGSTSYRLDRPAARFLQWERNDQWNAGLDFSFLGGRITASIDLYDKLSKRVLMEVKQPIYTGWNTLLRNAGEIRNRGLEVTLGATPVRTKDWDWRTDLTLSHNKGTFEQIPTITKMQTQGNGKFESLIFRMIEGEKLGTFYGYTYDGVWKTNEVNQVANIQGNTANKTNAEVYGVIPGQAKYRDLNGDGKYTEEDMSIIGCGQPMFNWGWNNTVNYRNFDFTVFVVGYHGFDIYNATRQARFSILPGINLDKLTPNPEWKNRWTPTNENSDIPGFVNATKDIRDAISSRFVENGSFVKVKSVTLGYSLPKSFCQKAGINNLRLYASVQNPFHFTSYSGLDPEAALGTPLSQGADWGAYPNGRNFLFGLNFSF